MPGYAQQWRGEGLKIDAGRGTPMRVAGGTGGIKNGALIRCLQCVKNWPRSGIEDATKIDDRQF